MRSQSRNLLSRRTAVVTLALAILAAAWSPAGAQAHNGPADPIASSYLAQIRSGAPGTVARVVGGDQRLWLQVSPAETLVVTDSRGAPYVRFSSSGVEVNHNSSLYYLNLRTPLTPPAGLTAGTPPAWVRASSGHVYSWHESRLHALASVALTPGSSYVGQWRIPVVVDGRPAAISGALFHSGGPSIVWFWPAAVLLLCLLAGWRLQRNALDAWASRGLGLAALAALAVGAVGRQLYGRPTVTAGQLIVLGLILAFVAGAGIWLLSGRLGFLVLLVIGVAAIGGAIVFVPTLVNGYVFTILPPFLARLVTVVCLACGPGLLLLAFRDQATVHADSRRAVAPA